MPTRGLDLMIGWIVARFVLGVGRGVFRTFVDRPEEPSVLALYAQDALGLGLTLWFVWAAVEMSRDTVRSRLGAMAVYGAYATLAADVIGMIHGHVMLALDAPRWLFVPSPLVGDLHTACFTVAWFGLLGLMARSGRELGLRGLAGLCTTSLVLMVAFFAGDVAHDVLRVRKLYWMTGVYDSPMAEQVMAASYDLPQLLLPAAANLAGILGFLVILVVLLRLRIQGPHASARG